MPRSISTFDRDMHLLCQIKKKKKSEKRARKYLNPGSLVIVWFLSGSKQKEKQMPKSPATSAKIIPTANDWTYENYLSDGSVWSRVQGFAKNGATATELLQAAKDLYPYAPTPEIC